MCVFGAFVPHVSAFFCAVTHGPFPFSPRQLPPGLAGHRHPCQCVACLGLAAQALDGITVAAVALLFFLHGAKLSRDAVVAGLSHWRLHLVVVGTTFVLFPLLGWALRPVLLPLVTPGLYTGILYLGVLPATVQSAIAFTAMARGNMPAAICSASASTLLGIVITPLLVGLLLPEAQQQAGAAQHDTLANIGRITLQLLVTFVAGHLLRPWIGGFVQRRAADPSACDHYLGRAPYGVLEGGRNHAGVLRLQEEPGQRRAHGQGVVCIARSGLHCAAHHGVPPDAADGVCGAGAALCAAQCIGNWDAIFCIAAGA